MCFIQTDPHTCFFTRPNRPNNDGPTSNVSSFDPHEDSKELTVAIHTVKHNYITSIITMRVLQRHVSALHLGHLQFVIRLDQLYYNSWSILGDWGVGGGVRGTIVPFLGGIIIGSMSSSYYQYVKGYCSYVLT